MRARYQQGFGGGEKTAGGKTCLEELGLEDRAEDTEGAEHEVEVAHDIGGERVLDGLLGRGRFGDAVADVQGGAEEEARVQDGQDYAIESTCSHREETRRHCDGQHHERRRLTDEVLAHLIGPIARTAVIDTPFRNTRRI